MAHDFNFPNAAIPSTSSGFLECREDRYRSERMKSNTAEALGFLLFEELNKTSQDAEDSEPERFSPHSVLFTNQVSSIRGSESNKLRLKEEHEISFDDTIQPNKRLFSENSDILNEVFFSSDVGKEIILQDQDNHGKEFMFKNDVTCTPCSSWEIFSRVNFPGNSSQEDTDHDGRRRSYTVGEFIKEYSEPLGSPSDDTFRRKVNFGCAASTPTTGRKISFSASFSNIDETLSNTYIQDQNTASLKTERLLPVLLYSVTPQAKKTDYVDDFNFHIGTTNSKNIQRLKAEEVMKAANCVHKLPISFKNSNDLADTTFGFLPRSSNSFGFDQTVFHSAETSFQRKDSGMEQWIVQPQELTLDVSSKGYRLLLINNSAKDLKFKIKFNSKITNVCPQSGILQARGQIGLRVLVSQFLRKNFNENIEDTVKITCGKTEKDICVKICKEQKSKNILCKERSYRCC